MARFGQPMKCDRACRCWHCKEPIAIGDPVYWEFAGKHRWCKACADVAPATEENMIATKLGELVDLFKVNVQVKPGELLDQTNKDVEAFKQFMESKFQELELQVDNLNVLVEHLGEKLALLETAVGVE